MLLRRASSTRRLAVLLILFVCLGPARAEIAATLRVAVDKPDRVIGARLYGAHLEHMFNSVGGGLWGELLQNRKMMPTEGRGNGAPAPWFAFGDEQGSVRLEAPKQAPTPNDMARSLRLEAPEGSRAGVAQGNLAARPGDAVRLSLWARGEGKTLLTVSLGDANDSVSAPLDVPAGGWRRVVTRLAMPRRAKEARLTLTVTGPGVVFVYAPSLMTEAAYGADGFEPAVLAQARALAPQWLRYPGGNFAQNYRWRDGVGPRDERPVRPNVWGGLPEPNDMGTDEFLALCRRLRTEPVLVVNVGGRGASPEEAAAWVAYCNDPAQKSEMGRLRAAAGQREPYRVRLWEIGNEVFGSWTEGSSDAPTYARNFDAYVRAMRAVDPTIRVMAVGQTPEWNRQVLKSAQVQPDLLSLHLFVSQSTPADVLTQPVAYETFLRGVGAGGPRLAVTEWNLNMKEANQTWLAGMWAASLLSVFQRVPYVAAAGVNGLVNGWEGGVIQRDGTRLFATPVHTVLQLYRRHTGARGLPVTVRGGSIPAVVSEEVGAAYPTIDVVASRDAGGPIFVCVVNKSQSESALLSFLLDGYKADHAAANLWVLAAAPAARNTWESPERVQPARGRVVVARGRFAARFPPFSVTWITVPPN
uniref:non-reducing end alpha-L-arabinofuranosidase n=1 Tax=uncultured Armatimonadetes bacterium TaxID=157466 RepID=A0A6J4IVK2_9BACT|nr:GH51 [uncultured Armatimonadetes bacterium]